MTTLTVYDAPAVPELLTWLAGELAKLLTRSPAFRSRRMWPHVVAVLRSNHGKLDAQLVGRGDWIGWARSNDLASVAQEALRRRVPPGHVLAYLELDSAAGAGCGFVLVPLAAIARGAKA